MVMKRKVLALFMSCAMLMQSGLAVSAEDVVFEEPQAESAVFEELPAEACREAVSEDGETEFFSELSTMDIGGGLSEMPFQTVANTVNSGEEIENEAESGLVEDSDENISATEEEPLVIEDMEIIEHQSEGVDINTLDAEIDDSPISLQYEPEVVVEAGQKMTLSVQASELNGKELTYQWIDNSGTVLSDKQICETVAPSEDVEYQCIVSSDSFSKMATIHITVQYQLELGTTSVSASEWLSSRTFVFTPSVDGYYAFYSDGNTHMEAELYDSRGNKLTEGDYGYDARINRELELTAGEDYKLIVQTNNFGSSSEKQGTITALYIGTYELGVVENNVYLGRYNRYFYFTPEHTGYYSFFPALKRTALEGSFDIRIKRADRYEYDHLDIAEKILLKSGVRYQMVFYYETTGILSDYEPGSVRIQYSTWAIDAERSEATAVPGYPCTLEVGIKAIGTLPEFTCCWTDPDGTLVDTTQDTKLVLEEVEKEGNWRCEVSDGTSSEFVEIQVSKGGGLTVWGDDTVYAAPGSTVTLQVFAESVADSISYQWYELDEEDVGIPIDGANTDTYTINNLSGISEYECSVESGNEYRVIRFYVEADTGLEVRNEENDVFVKKGDSVTMNVDAVVNPGYTLSYRWYIWAEDAETGSSTIQYLENATSASYTIDTVEESERYYCEVSDGYSTRMSIFSVKVSDELLVEEEGSGFVSVIVPYGEEQAILRVNEVSATSVTYKWDCNWDDPNQKDPELAEVLTKTTGPELTLKKKWFGEQIYCIIQNDSHTIENGKAVKIRFEIYVHLAERLVDHSIEVSRGGSTVLQVHPYPSSLAAGCSYQWKRNDEIVEGENGPSLSVENITDYANYICTISSVEKESENVDSRPKYCEDHFFAVYPDDITAETFETAKPLASGQKIKSHIVNSYGKVCFKICPETTDYYAMFADEGEFANLYLYDAGGKILKNNKGSFSQRKLLYKLTGGLTYYLEVVGMEGTYNISMMTARQTACTHVWEQIRIDPSACLPDGATVKKCVRCSLIQGDALSQSVHTFSEEWTVDKEPTCAENGEMSHHCTNCGERKDIRPIPATGQHTWDAGTVLQPSTCKVNGRKSYTCTVCGQTRTEELPLEAHSYSGEWVVDKEPTCTAKGEKSHHCSNCGERKDITEMNATGSHKWDDGTVTTPASCTADGTVTYKCAVCGETRTEKTPATGHVFGVWTTSTQATVFEPEKQTRACSVCGFTEEQTVGTKLEATGDLNVTSIKLKRKQSTKKVKVLGLAESDYVKSWESDNTKIVKVSESGKITAGKKTGKATITVTLASGRELKLQVKVQKPTVHTSKISGISKKITLQKGKKLTLKPVISPITSVDKVTYKSKNKKVATVSSKGVIQAKKKGSTVITVKSGKKSVKCKVTVK